MVDLTFMFTLLIAFQVKQFVCDFLLQTAYMQGKGHAKGWFFPLLSHVMVHVGGTFVIALIWAPAFWWLALVDLVVHFTIDRIKAHPQLGGRFPMPNHWFWKMLALDQMAHHLTHYLFIYFIVS